jgi:Tfp pilus assembly protein PilN
MEESNQFRPVYVLYILIVAAALGYVGYRWRMLEARKSALEAEYRRLSLEREKLRDIIEKANDFNRGKELLDQLIRFIAQERAKPSETAIWFGLLLESIPDEVVLSSLAEQDYFLDLEAAAPDNEKISRWVTNLKKSGCFTEIQLSLDETQGGKMAFRLTCRIDRDRLR